MVYQQIADNVVSRLKNRTQIHGSEIHDMILGWYYGRSFVDSYTTEQVIRYLVKEEILEPLEAAPTHSQAAFTGLQFSSKSYKNAVANFNTAYGLQTHFWFRVK